MKRLAMAATKINAEFLLDRTKQHGAPRLDLQTGRLHDQTLDAALLEEARQPEAVVARLIP